jgi:hypothetical protein
VVSGVRVQPSRWPPSDQFDGTGNIAFGWLQEGINKKMNVEHPTSNAQHPILYSVNLK